MENMNFDKIGDDLAQAYEGGGGMKAKFKINYAETYYSASLINYKPDKIIEVIAENADEAKEKSKELLGEPKLGFYWALRVGQIEEVEE